MAFSGFMVRRNLRNWLLPWCHCATALGNPELFDRDGMPGKSDLPRSPNGGLKTRQ
jgi:hypothetical protein